MKNDIIKQALIASMTAKADAYFGPEPKGTKMEGGGSLELPAEALEGLSGYADDMREGLTILGRCLGKVEGEAIERPGPIDPEACPEKGTPVVPTKNPIAHSYTINQPCLANEPHPSGDDGFRAIQMDGSVGNWLGSRAKLVRPTAAQIEQLAEALTR